MALSTLRMGAQLALPRQTVSITRFCVPMSSTSYDEIKPYWQKKEKPSASQEMFMFWQKNQRLQRPSSPWHIYKPQWTWTLSIANRVTGVAMTLGIYGLPLGLMAASTDFPSFVTAVQGLGLGAAFWFPVKTLVGWSFMFHTLNGIRHLFWDTGRGFQLSRVYQSGQGVFYASWILAAGLAAVAYL